MDTSDRVTIDLNDLVPGKVSVETAKMALARWNNSFCFERDVYLQGCSPTWAHLMVAGKLFGVANSITFVIDNGKDGVPVLVYKRR